MEDDSDLMSVDMQTEELNSEMGPEDELVKYIIDNYIRFEGISRVIKISRDDALQLGLSAETYDKMCESIESGNKMNQKIIEEAINNPEIKYLVFIDANRDSVVFTYGDVPPMSIAVETNDIPMMKNPGETTNMPNGTLTTALGETSSASFWAPWSMQGIKCEVFGEPMWSSHTVKTDVFGGQLYGSRNGNGTFTVGIAASNTKGKLTYYSNANYGKCVWNGY